MRPQYDYGAAVRVVRNVRNDGTFPGMDTGTLLIRCGSVGYVRNVGTFLQDQIIYEVHFLDEDRVVGCREEELIDAEEPWRPSQFEVRDYVMTTRALAQNGDIIVPLGERGQVVKVLRDLDSGVAYHVRFGEKVLQVSETALENALESEVEESL